MTYTDIKCINCNENLMKVYDTYFRCDCKDHYSKLLISPNKKYYDYELYLFKNDLIYKIIITNKNIFISTIVKTIFKKTFLSNHYGKIENTSIKNNDIVKLTKQNFESIFNQISLTRIIS